MEIFLFSLLSMFAVLSPGPGVVLTITNTARYGHWSSLYSTFGIAAGAVFTATISTAGLGVILMSSPIALTIFQYLGAMYLIFLGLRILFRKPSSLDITVKNQPNRQSRCRTRFMEGFLLQLTNPKSLLVFTSILPQFITPEDSYILQVFSMITIYAFLVVLIHTVYALITSQAQKRIKISKYRTFLDRTGGIIFLFFGLSLAITGL